MNFPEIIDLPLRYADKVNDTELVALLPALLPLVEARLNRSLSTQRQAVRTSVLTTEGEEYYTLPADFAGLRDIEVRPSGDLTDRKTMEYLSPEQMNERVRLASSSRVAYTIIANQLQVYPTIGDSILEIVYFRNIPPLTASNPSNWVSHYNPDVYIFGLMVEIMSYLKNPEAAALWTQRYNEAVTSITQQDSDTRWSGTSLTIKVGQ